MRQSLINEIYWGPNYNQAFAYGSHIQIDAHNVVTFDNQLMAAGRVLFSWYSAYNYQTSKTSPQLPILQVSRRYRLVFKGSVKPAGTLIFRLIFRDLQGQEIKRLNLTTRVSEFTCPSGTVEYELQLVNGGCTHLTFQRFELGPAALPIGANDDLWLQEGVNDQPEKQLTLLLVHDHKQYKRALQGLITLAQEMSVQALSVSWQYHGNLISELQQLLKGNSVHDLRLVSCYPAYDQIVLELYQQRLIYQALVTDRVRIINRPQCVQQYHWQQPATWLTPASADPDWSVIFAALHNQNNEEGVQ